MVWPLCGKLGEREAAIVKTVSGELGQTLDQIRGDQDGEDAQEAVSDNVGRNGDAVVANDFLDPPILPVPVKDRKRYIVSLFAVAIATPSFIVVDKVDKGQCRWARTGVQMRGGSDRSHGEAHC